MPIRTKGTQIFYYDETSQEWLEGTISNDILPFGYTVDAEVDGEMKQSKRINQRNNLLL